MKSLFFVLSFLAAGAALATTKPPVTNTDNSVKNTNTNVNQATGGKGGQGGKGGTGVGVGVGIGKGGKANAIAEGGVASATGGQSSAGSTSSNDGNSQTINLSNSEVLQRNNTPAVGNVYNAPTANCRITHGGGMSVPGFGASFGSSTADEVCQLIELSKQLVYLGLNQAATQILCQEPRAAQAMGHICHHTKKPEAEVIVQERVGG